MDRRVKKNQAAIMQAFMELIAERPFEKITIQAIAERADVNRGTVYSHYADKYELLDQCLESQLDQLIEKCDIGDDDWMAPSMAPLLRSLKHMEEHAVFYRNLLSINASPSFRSHFQARLNRQLAEQIADMQVSPSMNIELLAQFLSSAVIGVIEWWFTQPARCSAEEVAVQLRLILEQNQMLLLQLQRNDSGTVGLARAAAR